MKCSPVNGRTGLGIDMCTVRHDMEYDIIMYRIVSKQFWLYIGMKGGGELHVGYLFTEANT